MNHVRSERSDGAVAIVLDRPPVNVLDIQTMGEMREALRAAAEIPDLRVLVLRAEGKAFCAGVDVGEHTGEMAPKMLKTFDALIEQLLDFPLPTVALVQGAALGGGCEVTLACDLVLAMEKARFGQPEIMVGVYPPPAVALLPGLIGYKRAADLILTGRTVRAQEALELGLASRVFPEEEFGEEAKKLIAGLVGLSGSVLRHTIAALRSGNPFRERMETIEPHYLWDLMRTHDAQEGLQAFLEKRKAEWNHE